MPGRPRGRIGARESTKAKKSFTLSRSSVAFLEALRQECRTSSTSLVLDELIREAAARRRQAATERAIATYYDRLSEAEEAEQRAWGEFAGAQWDREPL